VSPLSFNGSLRDECLNVHWFETLDDAKEKIEAWRDAYNASRPHEVLKDLTPSEYALKCRAIETTEVVQQADK
jgi:putative transposase